MESLGQAEHCEGTETSVEKSNPSDIKGGDASQLSSGVVSSTQDDIGAGTKHSYIDESHEAEPAEDDCSKKKKRKENEEKEVMGKPPPVSRTHSGRVITGSKPPGPASKTGAAPLGKSGSSHSSSKGSSASGGKGGGHTHSKGGSKAASGHVKSSGGSKGKQDRKIPSVSPKLQPGKEAADADDDHKSHEAGPKVPPLKIVLHGGAAGSSGRNDPEGEGGSQRGEGKGRGSSTLPYVLPCTSTDAGQTSDSSDSIDDKKLADLCGVKGPAQRVLRSHRANDGDKDKERTSPQSHGVHSNKGSHASGSGHHDQDQGPSTSGKSESGYHPRKRKLKGSKDSHSRVSKHTEPAPDSTSTTVSHNITHANPYQLHIQIRKQVEQRQRALFPVKPKPPKDFNKYLMNRCTYTLEQNVPAEPEIVVPTTVPAQMVDEFIEQEQERIRIRTQHVVEKEKLVLCVEQEILRVHGRAERAVANQPLPYSVCTILRDKEVYNLMAAEQEEKRNAQRSRCNGRQINSWLQEVDDKWEKTKVGMLQRQHMEADSLLAMQTQNWEWKLKEFGLYDCKDVKKIDKTHVPKIHVSNFDLPA